MRLLKHTKLRKAAEQIHVLEAKLQEAVNENAKLNVKQVEDAKLWNGLDTKFSSTKALCDQLSKAIHKLADQNATGMTNYLFYVGFETIYCLNYKFFYS